MQHRYEIILDSSEDEELIEELNRAKDQDRLQQHLCNLLRLGHSVHLASTFQTSQESLQSLMQPLDGRIQTLQETVDRLTRSFQGSSTKGGVGEQIVISHLTAAFSGSKGDQFRQISGQGHTGDIEALMLVEDRSGVAKPVRAMVEAKLYENDVGAKEVQKFWEDLAENSYEFGLFISLNQRIAKQSSCINVQVREGKLGIIVYNEHQDQLRHVVAYSLMRELARMSLAGHAFVSDKGEVINELVAELNAELEELSEGLSMIGAVERAAGGILTAVSSQVTTIYSSAGSLRSLIQGTMRRIDRSVQQASSELTGESDTRLSWHFDVWCPAFDSFSVKHQPLLTALRETMLTLHARAPMQLDTTAKPEIRFVKDQQDLLVMTQLSTELQFKIPSRYSAPDLIDGKLKGDFFTFKLAAKQQSLPVEQLQQVCQLLERLANDQEIEHEQ